MDGQYLPDDEIDIDSLSSSEPPEYLVQGFARGGEASLDSSTESMNKYLLAEEEASPTAYATMPTEPQAPEMDMATAKSMLKRLATKSESRGKSSRPKGMGMELGDLTPAIPEIGAPPTEQEKLVKIATARSQFDALERAYKLKAAAAAKSGKGLSRPTFNALAFDQPTLEKPGPLMAKTFQFGGLVKAMKGMGKKGAPDPAQLMPSSAARGAQEGAAASPSIIKDEGGNWMGGYKSPEEFVKPLKKGAHEVEPRIAGELGIAPDPKQKALNQWIDKKMTPYIKNKMATPSDPLRKLAEEEGILPFPDTMVNSEVTANINRIAAGLPVEQQGPMATTTRGQAWENRADAAINVGPYNEMIPYGYSNDPNEVLRQFGGEFAVQNPTAKVSGMNLGRGLDQLGFDHVIDVLQENMTTGRLSPDSLRGLSMEDAVRLTYQYDQDMAKKMAEASIQALKGVPVYKQYPEQGFRWMQLDKPGYFAAESDAMGHSVRGYEPPKGHPDWSPQSGNSGNLSYGSYGGWEGIKKGDVKIYSLADDQGKRYTTVEAVKAQHPLDYPAYSLEPRARGETGFPEELVQDGSIPEEKLQEIYALGKKLHYENPNAYAENRLLSGAPAPSPMDSFQKAADQIIGELPFDIAQIKGPSNSSIKGEAQPFVQDFLNSGNWSDVSDLSLTGLRDIKKTPELEKYIKSNQLDDRRFLTEAEYNKYENDFLRNELKGQLGGFDPMAPSPVQPEGMAEGGEAKKEDKEDIPGLLGVSSYARGRAAGMFPEESSQWTSQDTARHMLASGTLARKYGPRAAELAGYAHEIREQPIRFIGAKLGMAKESPDYTQDVHNNLLGIELASRSKSQEDLLELVKQMAADARDEQTPGKAWKGRPSGSSPSVGRYGSQGPIKRADGSPATGEGELTQEEIDAASKPAFITPSSGRGRQAGNISKALASGKAYSAAAQGVTDLPYDIAGLPMDLTMLARQALTGLEPTGQFGTSDYIKKKMTGWGIRPEPPADPTEKGFFTAGELLSNFTNPASVARKVGPVVEKGVKAGAMEVGRQMDRALLDDAGPLAKYVPQAAKPLYISRSPGGYFPTSRGMAEKTAEEINNTKLSDLPEEFVSWLNTDDKKKTSFLGLGPKESLGNKYNRWKAETGNRDYSFGVLSSVDTALQPVLKKITQMEPGEKRDSLYLMFNQKAKDFYSKQAGSIQDPLRADILSGKLKFDMDSEMGDVFPKVLVKQAAQGNIQALRLLEKNYDDMLGIRASVPYKEGTPVPPTNQLRTQIIENIRDNLDTIPDAQLLAYAGKKPLPGPDGVAEAAKEVRLKLKENPNLFSTVLEPNIKRTIFARENRPISDLEMARFPGIYGTTATKSMINPQMSSLTQEQLMAMPALPEGYFLPDLQTAMAKGQPILDTREYEGVKLLGLNPEKLFQEANKLSPTELQTLSFNEFVKRAYTSTQEVKQLEKELEKVKPLLQQGKNPPANAMLFGVTDFLPTVNDMRWVKVTNPDGVKSIAAGMNNSVGSYASTDTYGALGRGRRALDSGEVEVYSLYDKNHVPQVTVEYVTNKPSVPEKLRGKIVQLTGNGPLTANAAPEKFSEELVDFVNKLKLSPEQVPVSVTNILKKNLFKFDEGKFVRDEEEFNKLQETRKKLGLAKGGSVDKNMAFIKKHT